MLAQDVMSTDIATVHPDTTLAEAIGIMLDRHVSGLPVVDGAGQLVGVLTEGDLLRRSETGTEPVHPRWLQFIMGPGRLAAEYVHSHSRRVEDLMTAEVVTVAPDTSLPDLVGLMESKRIKRVPVVQGDALVGLVSRVDLLRALARALAQVRPPQHPTDRAIHDAIMAEFANQRWVPAEGIKVFVDGGEVVLEGPVFDDRDRAAMLVVARNIPGVTAVRDELTWIEPVTGSIVDPAP